MKSINMEWFDINQKPIPFDKKIIFRSRDCIGVQYCYGKIIKYDNIIFFNKFPMYEDSFMKNITHWAHELEINNE